MVSSASLTAVGVVLFLHVAYGAQELLLEPQTCGGTFNSSVFSVATPYYPLRYPESLHCEVVVRAASATVCGLELDLGTLALPCPSDQLTVAGEPVCGAFPGAVLQAPFHWPQTLIAFRGNAEGGEGFNITVRQVECDSMGTNSWCGGELSGENIQLVSTGYPSSYPAMLECNYVVRAMDAGICKVEVNFNNSYIEESTNCSKDSLQINGDLLCGSLSGKKTYDIRGSLNITFKTDGEGSGKGFSLKVTQIRCVGAGAPITSGANGHVASEKLDSALDCGHNSYSSARDGYPVYSKPFPSFPTPQVGVVPPSGYYRPTEQTTQNVPPFRQYFTSNPSYVTPYQPHFQSRPVQRIPVQSFGPHSAYRPTSFYSSPSYQQTPYLHPYRNPYPAYTPSTPRPFGYWPTQPNFRQTTSQYQECCSQIYSDSHFLLVSPGFPRSTTTDCVYTISRYSAQTYQVRYQFRYFWAGEDIGTGCSGGYLEFDGNKVCGCKTGMSWTSQFATSETYKTLHLRLDYPFSRLFNGFVIEVYQDDAYSQRLIRANDVDDTPLNNTEPSLGTVANFSQYVETFVEREPLLPPGDEYQILDRAASQPIWDSSRQSWTLPTDWFCLRWNFQDWLVLAREVLWAKYQCPASSSSTSSTSSVLRSDLSLADRCRTCLYLCRDNCQCCST